MPQSSPGQRSSNRLWRWAGLVVLLLAAAEAGLRATTHEAQFLAPDEADFWKARLRQTLATTPPHQWIPPDLAFDATLGWRMKPGFAADGVHHDDRGYRETAADAAPTKADIVLLGDSFFYGLGVRDEQTIAAQLARVRHATVVDTAVAAHSVDQSLLMWETEARNLKPAIVVLGYAVDKFFTNPLPVRNLPKPWYDMTSEGLQLRGTPVPPPAEWTASGWLESPFRPRILQAARWLGAKVAAKLGHDRDLKQPARLNEALLTSLDTSVRNNGGRLLVAVIGHCFDGDPDDRLAERRILEACEKHRLHCIDLAAEMRGGDRGRYYGDNCHWSALGHRFAAERIAAAIASPNPQPRTKR